MNRLRVLAITLCLVLLTGCMRPPVGKTTPVANQIHVVEGISDVMQHLPFSSSVVEKAVLPQLKGARGIGFVRPEHRNIYPFDRPQTEEFRLVEGEPFEPSMIVINGSQNAKTFLVTTILDYLQIEFEVDGVKGLLHEIVVPPETEMELPYKTNIDSTGAHDVQIIAFDYPYNRTLEEDYRMDLYGYVTAKRVSVIVGQNESPNQLLEPLMFGTPIPSDVTFVPSVGFAKVSDKGDVHPSRRQLYVDSAHAGEPYKFQILLNNTTEPTMNYALISFLDYHQIEIVNSNIMLARLDLNQQLIIDAEIVLPSDPAIRQFQLIYLFDPYGSVLRQEVAAPFVLGSPRIALDAR
jgi:hypothetical protein